MQGGISVETAFVQKKKQAIADRWKKNQTLK